MKKYIKLLPILLIAAIATSCVSKKDYQQLQTNYDKLQADNKDVMARYSSTTQDLNVAKNRNARL